MFSGGVGGEQLERPTGRDVPLGSHPRHTLCDFTGCPRFPEFVDLGLGTPLPAMLTDLALDWWGLGAGLGSVPPQGISHPKR
jgi:hypothetical protein